MLESGTPAPDFSVSDSTGNTVSLSTQRGSWVLLWWYPKAGTPGWTLEGQGLRDQAQNFANAGCRVFGISFDTPEENEAFREANDFPFSLLSDPDRSVGELYGAIRDADDPYADYPKRVSFLIDPDGAVAKTYEVEDPGGHATQVLADLMALQR